ncbi:MAG: hypothetical protein DRO11_09980, partial [Methanobacteriota archaeon]
MVAVWLVHLATAWVADLRGQNLSRIISSATKIELWRSPPLLAILVFVIAQVASCAFSIAPHISFWSGHERWQGTFMILCCVAFALAGFLSLRNRTDISRFVNGLLIGGSVVAAMGIAQRLWPGFPIPAPEAPRISATLGNPVFLGAYLVLIIPIALSRWFTSLSSLRRVQRWRGGTILRAGLYTFLVFELFFCLLCTGSRGPWLGVLFAVSTFGILLGWSHHKKAWLLMPLFLLIPATLLVIVINLPGPFPAILRAQPYLSRLYLGAGKDLTSVLERTLIWRAALLLIRDRPAIGSQGSGTLWWRHLLGYGPETTQFTLWTTYPVQLFHVARTVGAYDRAHNRLLEITLTSGILGLLSYLALLMTFFIALFRQIKRANAPATRILL